MNASTLFRAAMPAALLTALVFLGAAHATSHPAGGTPSVAVRDTLPALLDTVRPDTIRPDTVRPDTVRPDTARGAAVPPDTAADAVAALLRQLQGYQITEYRSERATFQGDERVLRLHRSAEIVRGGERLTAEDTIVYRERRDMVEAYGRPTVIGQEQELVGEVLFYDLATRRATALGARTRIAQGSTWFVQGDVTLEEGTRVYASHARFTSCDLEIPHYHFEADRIMVIRDRILIARPARLYFGQVPVFVLPFIVQNLERGRRSGLLVPRFSVNDIVRTSSGQTREISGLGWYWAINDYLGAQVTGGWRSGAYTTLQGDLDYNWRRQFLNGNFSFRNYWQEDGPTNFNLNSRSSWRPDERTDLGLSAQYATSSQFIRDVSFDPRATTQDLRSDLRVTRRFDWATVALGAQRQQSIADDAVTGTLPSFSINPRTFTFFEQPAPELQRWYSNATLQMNASGNRSFATGRGTPDRPIPDHTTTQLEGGIQQLSLGRLVLAATGNFNRANLQPIAGPELVPGLDSAWGQWNSRISYQQRLMGQTMLSPTLSMRQEFRRSEGTEGGYMAGAMRPVFGASLSTAFFGFFPGVGPYSAIRHRVTPNMSYGYAPQAQQTEEQRRVFGPTGGRAENRISLTLDQSFEAKLRTPRLPAASDDPAPGDTVGADTGRVNRRESVPLDPQRVSLLSLSTSPITYDFVLADSLGNGFVTDRISNTIRSDFLRGLSLQLEHELFDRRELDPTLPENAGQLGSFAPRLSYVSTSFELGPGSALFRWLGLGEPRDQTQDPSRNAFPGALPDDDPRALGSGTATGNPIATGGGPWRASFGYSYTRPNRGFQAVDDRATQTLNVNSSFMLSEAWGVSWTTDYSITDREFGSHRLNFKRDLHRWQANFNFYQTPFGNSAFEFYVELLDNRDLKVQHREGNLRVDRRRR